MSKSESDIHRYALLFKALSSPHRLAIYKLLTRCCPPGSECDIEAASRCVGDLGESLDIAASTVSHHLKELHNAGLIQMERKGKQVMCRVDPKTLTMLSGYFA
jgi:DNA-binding transcriptional ArsR family regulator